MSPVIISSQHPLVLGSASPRRQQILESLGIPTLIRPANVDESELPGEDPEHYVARITRRKLEAVRRAVLAEGVTHSALLVADTTVVLDDEILGKPSDVADALRLLQKIAGRTHTVLTAYALAVVAGGRQVQRVVRSRVELRAASAEELSRYAHSGEGLDKAGAYAVQGLGAFLVRAINGSWSNVVGLPACEVVEDLQQLGLLPEFPARPEPV